MQTPSSRALRAAALCFAAVAGGAAHAQLIDDFRDGETIWQWPAMPLPGGGVFEANVAAGVPGGSRRVTMQPSMPNGPALFGYLVTGPGVGVHVQRTGMPSLTIGLGYGQSAPLNLDLSGQGALRLQVNYASTIEYGTGYFGPDPLSLTVYATTSNGAGLNPHGSAAEVILAPGGATDVPFSSFFTNASTGVGVNWADVDSLLFVFNDTQSSAWSATWSLGSISAVPEPAGWALFGAGGLGLLALRRRRVVAAALLALSGPAAMAGDFVVNIQGFGSDGAGTTSPEAYPLAPGALIALSNPVLVPLAAGSYSLRDAWGLPDALYDTWNFERDAPGSWASHYVAALVLPGGQYRVLVDGISLLDPACSNHFCAWDTQAQAAAAFAATPAYVFTLTEPATVAFVSADHFLPDNLGGISLQVSALPVPEPAPAASLLAGLATLAWLQRGRRGR